MSGGQPVVSPFLQVAEVDVGEYCRGGVVVGVGAAQLELGQLRGQVIQAPPALARDAGLLEVAGGAGLQRVPGELSRPCVLVAVLAGRDAAQGVVTVHLVQVVAACVAAGEVHVDQPGQHRAAVNGWLERLQQIVHRHRRHRRRVDGQRLHDLLAERVQALECLPDQDLDDLTGQHVLRRGEQARQAGVPVGGQDRGQRLQRPRETPRPLTRGRQQLRGGIAQPQRAVPVQAMQHLDRLC